MYLRMQWTDPRLAYENKFDREVLNIDARLFDSVRDSERVVCGYVPTRTGEFRDIGSKKNINPPVVETFFWFLETYFL